MLDSYVPVLLVPIMLISDIPLFDLLVPLHELTWHVAHSRFASALFVMVLSLTAVLALVTVVGVVFTVSNVVNVAVATTSTPVTVSPLPALL